MRMVRGSCQKVNSIRGFWPSTFMVHNCGELDPTKWSIEMPVAVSPKVCREWVDLLEYQPSKTSYMMYKEDRISQPLTINDPVQFRYLARGRTYIKLGLPTDASYQVSCYGETFKP